MAKYCANCGEENADSATFCTECGTPISEKEAKTEQKETDAKQKTPAPQDAAKPNQAAYAAAYQVQANSMPETSGIVSAGYFFGMMFLYSIPVVGWLVCLITAFAPKNRTKKNFAKAVLIWLVIGLVLSVIGYFVARGFFSMLTGYLNNGFGSQFIEFSGFFG